MLTLRDREISKKDILMDKMKNSHVENHSRIMDLQSELMRLQEHSHQVLLRYDRHCISPQSLYSRDPPNHRSLQSEMQDMQQHHRALDDVGLPSLHMHTDDIQSIIHRIKSTEIAHLLQNKFPERDSSPVETQERPFPHRQQQQASIKQQLVNVLQELELQKCVWEEKGEKVEERRRASEKEQKQSQTQIPDGKKVAVVNWWRALSTEQAKARTKETQSTQELSETQEKLQRAEKTISDMREQICHLQVSLRSALECVSEQKNSSGVCHINKGTNTLRVVADKAVGTVVRDQRDAVVTTEITGGAASQQEQAQLQLTTSRLLKTLRRMEAMVANALEKAELVRESEQRVSQVRARMESITYRVEEALGRTSATDEKLNVLEERVAEKDPNQYPGPGLSADPEPEVTSFTAESDVEPETRERTESPPLSPIIPELSEPPLMNGSTGCGSCSKEEEEHLLQESPSEQSDHNYKKSCDKASAAETPFIFPHTRSHPPLLPSMPTLPEEEEDSPEELDSSSSSPSTSVPCETRTVVMTAPTIVYPQQATIIQQDGRPMEQARPHSPRARVTRNSSGGPITTVGPQSTPTSAGNTEAREKSDAMPNISDVMLRKLKLHRGLPGCAPPLSEKEVENAFVQLSLAFRNDNYTLETRLKQAERERNLTEEDTEKELEEFKGALKMTSPQWQNLEQREAYQRLTETVAVLHRLATRLSSRAEIVGAVRQEKRMNKATEVMMQYVENLKRTYEKDHAELMEFKKLANQNSNRCYGGTVDTGDDGVARSSRSMSLTLGKALPRRRVSVAVVPKFNLLNIPGQTPATAGPGPNLLTGPSPSSGPNPALGPSTGPTTGAALPVLCEANDMKVSTPTEAVQPAAECGKSVLEQESEPAKPAVNLEEIRAEIRAELKAKIEEESYNKGYQEGLKQSKVNQDEKHEEENTVEKLLESTNKDEESGRKMKTNRRMEEVLARFGRYCPKISLNRRLLWMALTLFVVMCLVISIFSFFSHYYNRREDT
nr:PREDICTED: protein MRVI1 [Paralichthys olivaceus]